VDESNFRLRADFQTADDARSVVGLLETAPEFSKDGASLSYPGSGTLFLYAPTANALEHAIRTFRVSADGLGLRPVSVAAGQWLSDEEGWSDEASSGFAVDGSGSVVVGEIAELIGALLNWP
jgi:hypothetical protein